MAASQARPPEPPSDGVPPVSGSAAAGADVGVGAAVGTGVGAGSQVPASALGAVRKGSKSTVPGPGSIESPVPPGDGPVASPHQLPVASTVTSSSSSKPLTTLPLMLFPLARKVPMELSSSVSKSIPAPSLFSKTEFVTLALATCPLRGFESHRALQTCLHM